MGFGYIVLATGHTAKKNNAYIIIQSCFSDSPNPNMAVFIYLFIYLNVEPCFDKLTMGEFGLNHE